MGNKGSSPTKGARPDGLTDLQSTPLKGADKCCDCDCCKDCTGCDDGSCSCACGGTCCDQCKCGAKKREESAAATATAATAAAAAGRGGATTTPVSCCSKATSPMPGTSTATDNSSCDCVCGAACSCGPDCTCPKKSDPVSQLDYQRRMLFFGFLQLIGFVLAEYLGYISSDQLAATVSATIHLSIMAFAIPSVRLSANSLEIIEFSAIMRSVLDNYGTVVGDSSQLMKNTSMVFQVTATILVLLGLVRK